MLGSWAAVQGLHVALRYNALSTLVFPTLNLKRAALLVTAHVAGRPLPDVATANQLEPMLVSSAQVTPRVTFGVSVEEAWGPWWGGAGVGVEGDDGEVLREWCEMFEGEGYWMVWRGGRGYVVLEEGFRPQVLLRALWQAAWLEAQEQQQQEGSSSSRSSSYGQQLSRGGGTGGRGGEAGSSGSSNSQTSSSSSSPDEGLKQQLELLRSSLVAVHDAADDFEQKLQEAGWDSNLVSIKVGEVRGTCTQEQQQQQGEQEH